MLSSALNFLSDKRKRFHRSDTMPAFTNDSSLFRLANDLPDMETCPEPRRFQQHATFHEFHSNSSKVRDDLIKMRIETGSNGDLPSLSDRTNLFNLDDPIQTSIHPTNLNRSCELGGSDKDLTSRFKRNQDSPSPNSGSRNLSSRNQEAKLKFLNIPTTTISANYGTSSPNSAYMQSCSRSGTDSSPTPSMTSWNSKKSMKVEDCSSFEPDRELFKQSLLMVENMETVVIGSSSAKENEPTEELPASITQGQSRVARLQTKGAASKLVKNKVKRSKSTVHTSRRMRDSSREQMIRERASSVQRKPSDPMNEFKSGNLTDEPRIQSVKYPIVDKASASISTNVSSNRSRPVLPNYAEQENVAIHDLKRNYELLISLANRGSKMLYYRINAHECMEPKTSDHGLSNADNTNAIMISAGVGCGGHTSSGSLTSAGSMGQFLCPDRTKPILSDNLSVNTLTTTTPSSKLNKYAVVRRLRRNNSSMASMTEKSFRSFDEPTSSNSAADDLLLPSKKLNAPIFANRSITGLTQDKWISDLFDLVEHNNLEQFLRLFEKFHILALNLSPEAERLQNQYELNPLDCAFLNGYVTLAIYMILCGFGPGPILQYNLKCGPSSSKTAGSSTDMNTMRIHLKNLLQESDARLLSAQEQTKQTVEQANSLTQSFKLSKETNNSGQLTTLNHIYAKVGLQEQALAENILKQDQLLKFSRILDQYPAKTKPPRRVRLLLEGSHSILVRVTPSRSNALQAGLLNHSDIVYNEKSSCSSSDDLESSDWLSEGRKVGLSSQSDLALKYRIEWSHCPKFLNSPVYSCTVEPVFYLHGIYQEGDSIQVRNLNHLCPRTGFYLISNLTPGKMVFVRVYTFSMHGWSEPCYSQPPGINLSNWYECKPIANVTTIGEKPQQRFVGDSLLSEIELQKQILIEKVITWLSGNPPTSTSTVSTTPTSSVNVPNSSSGSSINSGIVGSGTAGPTTTSTSSQQNTTPTSSSCQTTGQAFDDMSKRNRSPMLQRKRSFRFLFSNKGFRFVKQIKSGLYLAVLCHTPIRNSSPTGPSPIDLLKQKYQLVLADDSIPMINVTREDVFNSGSSNLNSDFNWFSKLVSDSSGDIDVQLLCEDAMRSNLPTNLQLRIRLFGALQRLRFLLGTANMGTVYPEIIKSKLIDPNLIYQKLDSEEMGRLKPSSCGTNDPADSGLSNDPNKKTYSSAVIVLLRQVHNPNDVCLTSNLRWYSMDKFLRQNKIKRMDFVPSLEQTLYSAIANTERMTNQLITNYSHLLSTRGDQLLLTPEAQIVSNLDSLIYYSGNRTRQLEPGLYLALIQMQANLDQQPTILVSNSSQTLQMFPCQRIRRRSHVSREEWDLFFQILANQNRPPDAQDEQRYEIRDTERRFVVQLLRTWSKLASKLGLPNQTNLQYRIYLSEIIKLSPQHAIIPCFPPVDQVCLRPGLVTVTPPSCYWTSMAHFERNLGLVYDPLFNPQLLHLSALLELLIPISQFIQRQCFTDQELSCSAERTQSLQLIQSNLETMMQGKRWLSETLAAGRDRKRMDSVTISFGKIIKSFGSWLPGSILMFFNDADSGTGHPDQEPDLDQGQRDPNPSSAEVGNSEFPNSQYSFSKSLQYCSSKDKSPDKGTSSVIQVYADYPSGLASGTYVRLLIYSKTTAHEIVQIVIHQIKETVQKNSMYYPNSEISDLNLDMDSDEVQPETHSYCLTVSLGQVERRLPSTIRPLLLRYPWRSGKFAVRLTSQVSEQTNQNDETPTPFTNDLARPYRISKKHGFKLTVVENPFVYAHVDPPPRILP